MRKLLLWLKGYVMVCVSGPNARRFLTLLAGHGMLLPGTFHGDGDSEVLYAKMPLESYKHVSSYARKCRLIPLVCERKGLPFLWQKLCFYKVRTIGLGLFIFLLYFLQNFLWSIQIQGNSVHTTEQLLRFLREEGIYAGIRVSGISCEKLETMIRNEYSDIIWVSCEKDGTRLKIRIKESFPYEMKEDAPYECGDLVADKAGVITKLLVRAGTPLVKIGDEVQPGDILVSGTRIVKDPYDVEISRSYVLSDADIEISMTIEDRLAFPMRENIRVYEEKKTKKYTLSAFGRDLVKYKTGIPPGKCDIITTYADLRLFDQLYLPVAYSRAVYLSYQTKEQVHTEETMREKVRKAYLQYLEDCVDAGYEVLSEQSLLTFQEDAAELTIRLEVVCRGCHLAEIDRTEEK